jgi:hypothetical protein
MKKNRPLLRYYYKYLLILIVSLISLACGGGGGGGNGGGSSSSNQGWVTISGSSNYTTESTCEYMTGGAFISPTWSRCCSGSADDTGVTVTWTNVTTGVGGNAYQYVSICWFFRSYLCDHTWSADVPLTMGQNLITVTATDPSGNVGKASVTVTRVPDVTLPLVKSTNPVNNATGVAVDAKIAVTFSEEIDASTVNSSTFTVKDSGNNPITGTIICCANKKAEFTPVSYLVSATLYTATVTNGIQDLAGNSLATDYSWNFTTGSNYWQPTSTVNAPYLTQGNTVVWTGTEMIVWQGGVGGRYNPLTDTWQQTSTTGTPAWGNTAVWTGTEMIVWNGMDATGGKYNLITDSWQPISTTNAPCSRLNYTGVWTGNEMIIWGGSDNHTGLLVNSGGKYNPLTDTWQPTSITAAPTPRYRHSAVWTGTEMIIWGGGDNSSTLVNTGGKYNPMADTWESLNVTNAPTARDDHSAVWTGSEMVVWGGYVGGLSVYTNTGGKYNPTTNKWRSTTTFGAPVGRVANSVVWTGGEMIVWGGDTGGVSSKGGRYNPVLDHWSEITTTNEPSSRYWHTAVWTGSQMIVWGGNVYNKSGGRYTP